MLAHEIKNPLAGITGAAQLLSMNLEQGDLELTDLIVDECRRIVKLLEQVEQFVEQACEGMDRGCVTYEHGKTLLTNIQMWSAKKRKFERYELSKHPGCTAEFDFSDARGFLLLQLRNRIGLLPSPRSNDGADSDKLDIF